MLRYVLVTPAYNEEVHLEKTIQSVLAQTCRPCCWVIVNDGSTDQTGDIAERYRLATGFIRVLTVQRDGAHSFGKKAHAFNAGIKLFQDIDFDLIGNLDADISIQPHYFENLIRALEADPRLGITGGSVYHQSGEKFVSADQTLDSVGGAVQFFRKECFADVGGGYLPLPYGGIDAAAEIIAKMKGWTVRKSLADHALEDRQTGTAAATPMEARYRLGKRFHSLGYGAFYFLLYCLYRLGDKPYVVSSLVTYSGYLFSVLKRRPLVLPDPVVKHLQAQQRLKLRRQFSQLAFRFSFGVLGSLPAAK